MHKPDITRLFDRGVVVLSFDTEQIWGYFDHMSEAQFQTRYPDAVEAHEKLLARLTAARICATWFVVGGMALPGTEGPLDGRMARLPADWVAGIPEGSETTAPIWYRQSFISRLRDARPHQEIGLHAGLTHFIWTDTRATREVVQSELAEGVKALVQASIQPRSFSFAREQHAYHDLLLSHGIQCFRGRTPMLASQLGQTMPGALLRIVDELMRAGPPPVWPCETLPGLWTLPSSLFLYPIGRARTAVLPLRSRVQRFSRGIEAAARCRGVFHFCLHPENLAESPQGFSLFDEFLEQLDRARSKGDVEVLTVSEAVSRAQLALGPSPHSDTASTSLAGRCS
jgi:hypothetical protein